MNLANKEGNNLKLWKARLWTRRYLQGGNFNFCTFCEYHNEHEYKLHKMQDELYEEHFCRRKVESKRKKVADCLDDFQVLSKSDPAIPMLNDSSAI